MINNHLFDFVTIPLLKKPIVREKKSEHCQFYVKIGACRHGDKCSRIHSKPTRSRTILLKNLYRQAKVFLFPYGADPLTDALEQAIFDEFYEEVYTEVEDTCGEIRELHVCENHGAHLSGNVYVRFCRASAASRAVRILRNRFFAAAPIDVELSPVVDFVDACCRQHQTGSCSRGGICNFMHVRAASSAVRTRLKGRPPPRDYPSSSEEDSEAEVNGRTSRTSSSKRMRKSKSKSEEREEDDIIPSKYKEEIKSPSDTSTSSSCEELSSDSDSVDSRATPKAFREDRFISDKEELSDNDQPITCEQRKRNIRKMQIIRQRRWAHLKAKLDETQWDDEKERNYVFSLL